MARILRFAQLRDVLYLEGTDVANVHPDDATKRTLIRSGVKAALFAVGNGVGNFRGQVDFIICYVANGVGGDFSGVDHAPHNESPALRPLRGIIQLPDDLRQPMTPQRLQGHLSGGVSHETGHYWLVPGAARVRINGQMVDTPTPDDIPRSLNNGNGIPPVPIMGRQDSHWSPFIHSEGSPMDGVDHQFDSLNALTEQLYGYSTSGAALGTGVTFSFEGQDLTSHGRYSDFEQFIMGLPPAIGNPRGRTIQVMEPRLVSPLQFHAGLYLELADGNVWYHGFHRGPDRVLAQAVSGAFGGAVPLNSPFDPDNRVAFRVVQRGGEFELQTRVWPPRRPELEGCLYQILTLLGVRFVLPFKLRPELTCEDIVGGGQFAPAANVSPYDGWHRHLHSAGTVRRLGIAARHMGASCFARIKPRRLCLRRGNTTIDVAPALATENPVAFANGWGATVLADGSLVLPYREKPNGGVNLLHDAQNNNAPRRVMDAPGGDFVYGGEIQLAECIIVPHAGGTSIGKRFIGRRREVRFSDVDFLSMAGPEFQSIRQAEPQGGRYRFLFCLVSRDALTDPEITAQLTELDRVRRAWEPCFSALTLGRRGADTTIPF